MELSEKKLSASKADLQSWADAINSALKKYSDKDWCYSRITLQLRNLSEIKAPYGLWIDWIDTRTKEGTRLYKEATGEVTWGLRHSSELGILELISLRLNQAIQSVTTPDYWHGIHPVVRLQKIGSFGPETTHAFWYEVQEVQGEEFETR